MRGRAKGTAGHRGGAPPGLRPAGRHDQSNRAPADRAGVRLRAPHQGHGSAGRRSPGLLRAADRRDHRLPVHRAVPVQEAHRAGAGRAVRRAAVVRHGRRHHRPRCRETRWLPGAGAGEHHRQRRGRVRRNRVPGRRPAALGALRPHRQIHPAHGAPQARQAGDRGDGHPAIVRGYRRARRLGRQTTPTSTPATSFAAPTPSASFRPSATPRRTGSGAGPLKPPRPSPRCNNWSARQSASARPPIRPPSPSRSPATTRPR